MRTVLLLAGALVVWRTTLPASALPASVCVDDPAVSARILMGGKVDPGGVPVNYETAVAQLLATHAGKEYLMWQKHLIGYFYSRTPPPKGELNPVHVTQQEIDEYLMRVDQGERPAAILAYWQGHSSSGQAPVCVGLIRAGHEIVVEVSALDSGWRVTDLLAALKVRRAQEARGPRARGMTAVEEPDARVPLEPAVALARVSQGLLPGRIADALAGGEVRSLLVVPIKEIGSVPFAALPVGPKAQRLSEITSIVVAPGIQALHNPRYEGTARRAFRNALVVGDPDLDHDKRWIFPPLSGARGEAEAVAKLTGATARVGATATRDAVLKALNGKPPLDLIYLATHAVSDPKNPFDESFVALSGRHLYTRDIQKLRLRGSPLVVLSACQTGLGKRLDGGIFGMAYNWWAAGAGSVVMSLWNVNDEATQLLMTEFMSRAAELPPARALAEAMRAVRRVHSDPALWASFSVYGGLPLVHAP